MIKSIFIFLFTTSSFASSYEEAVKSLKKNISKEAGEIAERIVACNHWTGEEGYDENRRKEILKAIKKLKCAKLDVDKAAILKRNKAKKKQLIEDVFKRASKIIF